MNMTMIDVMWPGWIIVLVLTVAGRQEITVALARAPWWHRVLGAVAAVAFYGSHLGLLK